MFIAIISSVTNCNGIWSVLLQSWTHHHVKCADTNSTTKR